MRLVKKLGIMANFGFQEVFRKLNNSKRKHQLFKTLEFWFKCCLTIQVGSHTFFFFFSPGVCFPYLFILILHYSLQLAPVRSLQNTWCYFHGNQRVKCQVLCCLKLFLFKEIFKSLLKSSAEESCLIDKHGKSSSLFLQRRDSYNVSFPRDHKLATQATEPFRERSVAGYAATSWGHGATCDRSPVPDTWPAPWHWEAVVTAAPGCQQRSFSTQPGWQV